MPTPSETDLTCDGLTDKGRVRPANEDSIGIFAEAGIFVVADGVGGSENGALASRMVVEACERAARLAAGEPAPPEDVLRWKSRLVLGELDRVNRELRTPDLTNPARGGASTVAVLLLDRRIPGRGQVLFSGDSRVYTVREEGLVLVTRDHIPESEREWGMESGIGADHRSNRITQAIGARGELVVEAKPVRVRQGDFFLLCTDGLYKMLRDAEMHRILADQEFRADGSTSRALADAANQAGGRDNLSLVLVRVGWPIPEPGVNGPDGGVPDTETSKPLPPLEIALAGALPPPQSDSGSGESTDGSRSRAVPAIVSLNLGDTEDTRTRTDPLAHARASWKARAALRRLRGWPALWLAGAVMVLLLALRACSPPDESQAATSAGPAPPSRPAPNGH